MSISIYTVFANCEQVGTFRSTLNGAKIMARRLQAALPHASITLRRSQGPVTIAVTGNQRHRVLLANAENRLAGRPVLLSDVDGHDMYSPVGL